MFQLMEKISILCSFLLLLILAQVNMYVCCNINCKGGLLLFSLLIVTPILGFYNCTRFCCALLCVHSPVVPTKSDSDDMFVYNC